MVTKSTKVIIFGRKPIEELLATQPSIVNRIWVEDSVKNVNFENIRKYAKQSRIAINSVPELKLRNLVGADAKHQGVVAELSYFPYTDFDKWLSNVDTSKNPAVFLLDEIQAPHNVGAIIRTAAAAGMSAVLMPEHRQAPVNGTVFKTSAGACIHIPIVRIGNVVQTLSALKEKGFWAYAIIADGETSLFDYDHTTPAVFVLGNEGDGIRRLARDKCDGSFVIPMPGNNIESLNVAATAAVVAYEYVRKSVK